MNITENDYNNLVENVKRCYEILDKWKTWFLNNIDNEQFYNSCIGIPEKIFDRNGSRSIVVEAIKRLRKKNCRHFITLDNRKIIEDAIDQ